MHLHKAGGVGATGAIGSPLHQNSSATKPVGATLAVAHPATLAVAHPATLAVAHPATLAVAHPARVWVAGVS